MLDFSTKHTFESKVIPGATVTIRRLSEAQRAKRDARIIAQTMRSAEITMLRSQKEEAYRVEQSYTIPVPAGLVGDERTIEATDNVPTQRVRDLQLTAAQAVLIRNMLPSSEEVPEMSTETALDIVRLNYELDLLNKEFIFPATLRAGLVSVTGVTYDGQKATADLLLENGPDALVHEIVLAIEQHASLTVEQQKNSSSQSDSLVPVAQADQSTPAITA